MELEKPERAVGAGEKGRSENDCQCCSTPSQCEGVAGDAGPEVWGPGEGSVFVPCSRVDRS